MERQFEPVEHRHRPRRHLAADRQAVAVGALDLAQQGLPAAGIERDVEQGEGERPARELDQAAQHGELGGAFGRRCPGSRRAAGSRPCPPGACRARSPPAPLRPAVMVGVSAPSGVRWNSEREVVKPSAPACKPLLDQRGHRRHVGGRRRLAIDAALAHDEDAQAAHAAPGSRSRCRSAAAASASRYSGKLCQFHGTPSRITSSGMSSTPSMTLISVSRSCGRQGAKPTPQLPISTVVTPWPEDGVKRSSQVTCPS